MQREIPHHIVSVGNAKVVRHVGSFPPLNPADCHLLIATKGDRKLPQF